MQTKTRRTSIQVVILIAVLSAFTGCVKNDVEKEIVPKLTEDYLATGGDGKNDLLGYGYDVTGSLMGNESASDAPIINLASFVKDHSNKIDAPTNSKAEQHYYSGATAFDYLSDITKKRSGSFGLNATGADGSALFSLTLSGNRDTQKKYTFSSKYSFASFEQTLTIKRIRFTQDVSTSMLIKYLTPEFIKNVDTYSADALVKRYGTHVLLDISLGGRLMFDYSASIVNEDNYQRKTRGIEAGLSAGLSETIGIKLSLGMSTEEITKAARESRNKVFSLKFYGGTNSGRTISFDADGRPSESINIASWEQSVNVNNASLVDIGKAIPLYEFIADPAKKSAVKAAIDKHILNSQINVIDVLPLHKVFSKGDKNHMYVTSKAAADQLVRDWGNEYQGIIGYILAKPNGSSTIPLHYMKSIGDKNNFFLTNMAAVNEHIVRWRNIHYGISGYLSSTLNSETLPLYQVKSHGDKNTMYVTSQAEVDELVNRWKNEFQGTIGYIIAP
ncbi:MAC/perforin domain-containing protein [Parapedobacter tibetensis]|uniref:MAC/perforin domain-containing protein n=1 Tax=Parapedobacter tibetensis TaxID=2972951 RepID=UPI00214DC9F3|nr:MAC/perforin domain-containing protein [Parapedobacter tibetensis]